MRDDRAEIRLEHRGHVRRVAYGGDHVLRDPQPHTIMRHGSVSAGSGRLRHGAVDVGPGQPPVSTRTFERTRIEPRHLQRTLDRGRETQLAGLCLAIIAERTRDDVPGKIAT